MIVTSEAILQWLAGLLWPLARVSSLVMVMAVFGSKLVPARVRMGFALSAVLLIMPLLPSMPAIHLFSGEALLVLVQQILIGIALGLITQLLLETFVMAGQVIAMQTSLGFATLVDPMNGQSAPVVGQFYLMLATLIFLALDGHLQLIEIVMHSFVSLPISTQGLSLTAIHDLVGFLANVYQGALLMSLSAIIALLIINLGFGIMTRAAPQLNIFSIGFAVSMMAGLLILWLTIGGFLTHFDSLWHQVRGASCQLIDLSCEAP